MAKKNKTLQELTIKDNFMFTAVMSNEDNAKAVLECILGIEIEYVKVEYEKTILYNPEYKSIRLDVYIKDGNGRFFNVEMQSASEEVFKRSRYYHSIIDSDILESGADYETLSDSYVIFICDFDPVGFGKYKYTVKKGFKEAGDYEYNDGSYTLFLSTKGTNESEESKDLVSFLKYVEAAQNDCNIDYSSECVRRLQKSVNDIKASRKMRKQYMNWQEIRRNDFNEGKAEGKAEDLNMVRSMLLDAISTIGVASDELVERIMKIDNLENLNVAVKRAIIATSVSEFEEELTKINL
ncbi:MAG: Rpn family recombination-promoting nuclease/putative transposase [Lachnospiraceae bacterium]|nr:Rpn family recombination-promoting nuclease/putative transposase [Lachnospiraceae bacterium]